MEYNWAAVTAGAIFIFVALIHLYRLINPFTLIIGDYVVPVWINAIGFVIAGMMAGWIFYSLNR